MATGGEDDAPAASHVDPDLDACIVDETDGIPEDAKHVAAQLKEVTKALAAERKATRRLTEEVERVGNSKMAMAAALMEAQEQMDALRARVVELQVEKQGMATEIEELKEALDKSERAEQERFAEVEIMAQRLREAEVDLEDMERTFAQVRAPPMQLHNHHPYTGGPNNTTASAAGKIAGGLGGLIKGFMGTQGQIKQGRGHIDYPPEVAAIFEVPGNGACADCGAATMKPSWVSVNHGVLICTRCAGIHRSFGTHVSKVRSLTLDKWEAEDLAALKDRGNVRGNKRLLEDAAEGQETPVDAEDYEKYLRTKYVEQRWVRAWGEETQRRVSGEEPAAPAPGPPAHREFPGQRWMAGMVERLNTLLELGGESAPPESPLHLLPLIHDEVTCPQTFTPGIYAMAKDINELMDIMPSMHREPIPEVEALVGPVQRAALAKALPISYRRNDWVRLYSNIEHGSSLRQMAECCKNRGPNLVVLRTTRGHMLGGFCSTQWEVSRLYQGSGEAFVFRFASTEEDLPDTPVDFKPTGDLEVFHWSGCNEFFFLMTRDLLAFGGGSAPALCFDASLGHGTTGQCSTYNSPPLTDPDEFAVMRIEVWGVHSLDADGD